MNGGRLSSTEGKPRRAQWLSQGSLQCIEWEEKDAARVAVVYTREKIFRNEGDKDNDKAGKQLGQDGRALLRIYISFRTYFYPFAGHLKRKLRRDNT